MTQTIDISPYDLEIVWRILNKHLKPSIIKWVFGSRAKWSAKTYSDLDLALQDPYGKTISFETIALLRSDFEDSDLPWKVDIIDLNDTDEDFRKVIEIDRVKLPAHIPSHWNEYYLTELYDISSGLSKPASDFGSGYPFLAFTNVFNNYFVPTELDQLVQSSEKERSKCSIKRGDVFLTRTSETMHELGMSCVALRCKTTQMQPLTVLQNGFAQKKA